VGGGGREEQNMKNVGIFVEWKPSFVDNPPTFLDSSFAFLQFIV
jgi:hypothetical protein